MTDMTSRKPSLGVVDIRDRENVRKADAKARELGDGDAVRRFVSKYGSVGTKAIYTNAIALYFRWLRKLGITMTPDEMVLDNLKCVYESNATEVATKRKHTDWLDRYVNGELVKEGIAENTRHGMAAAIKMFYKRNDSPLFDDDRDKRRKSKRRTPMLHGGSRQKQYGTSGPRNRAKARVLNSQRPSRASLTTG
jgi:hypothetical protein